MLQEVVLVDEQDHAIGAMEKMLVHEKGLLHRAFSVFIFNSKNEILLQQRSSHKYHSPELWTNTCCSHPDPHQDIEGAATERLLYEMGLTCPIKKVFSFIYKATFDNGLTEHEYDHVFIGYTDDLPRPHTDEVMNYRYMTVSLLQEELEAHPEKYTAWLRICLPQLLTYIQ